MGTAPFPFTAFKLCLIYERSLVWPTNLVTCALFNTLHQQQYSGIGDCGGISRERFFSYIFFGSFCWYWFPDYIFQAMSYFNWVCWILPNNVVINQLFGYSSGLVRLVHLAETGLSHYLSH